MSKNLHITPKLPLEIGQKWDKAKNCLTLTKAGAFKVVATNFDQYMESIYPKPKSFTPVKKEDYDKMTKESQNIYKRKFQEYNDSQDAYENNADKERASIEWCWKIVGKGIDPDKIAHNNTIDLGISIANSKQMRFPKLLEGGGMTWLEIFNKKNPPMGVPPHGMFVRALGTPKVIAAEWRDYTGALIEEEIAFGSTVYLHIYTEALFGENIQIQLRDTKLANADLTPTPSDADGDPIQKLDPNALTKFVRPVEVYQFTKATMPPEGSITDVIVTTEKGKTQTSSSNVQKCVFPVFIEQAWQIQGSGLWDSGSELSINPIVYHGKIENGRIDLEDTVLKVSKNGILMQGELSGNNPLMQGEAEKGEMPEEQKKIDFTFGVFIDGTNNNRYNTIARTDWEEKRIRRRTTQDNPSTSEEHLKVYAKNENEVGENENYKYQEGSYENDLSNVAILFDNYIEDKGKNTFKIYTEGMNTNTLGDENLNVSKYKGDDFFMGGAFGAGNSGIIDRVRRTVEQVAGKISKVMAKEGVKKINSITIDVFGFSRGAASARHFVHDITHPAYYATMGLKSAYCDHQGYTVSEEYFERKKALPTNGYLGYILSKSELEFNQLIIRFAGIYDTVAHHGTVQYNDIRDLGLNSISKAKSVVHIVAAEEHRKNFSLSPIIKKQNHIELYFPGVHCDVGGSYIEGRPEGIVVGIPPDPAGEHILATDYCNNTSESRILSKFRDTLIDEGWFTNKEIGIRDAFNRPYRYDPNSSSLYDTQQLVSHRAYISNQYSFIPLHIMCNLGIEKGVRFNFKKLTDSKDFRKNIFTEHLSFIKKIKTYLEEYASIAVANPTEITYHGIPKEYMRVLRNHYLHYNATTGLVNAPEDERKRFIIKH